jgi:Lysozyme inhibitor LprI
MALSSKIRRSNPGRRNGEGVRARAIAIIGRGSGYVVVLLTLIFGLAGSATAIEWPKGFVLHSGTESPGGRYGILVPPNEPDTNDDSDCYLADLQAHRVLGKLEAVDYFEHQNHAGLSAIWSTDSKRSIVIRDGRFGFDTITLLELDGRSFHAVDLGTFIQRSLGGATAKGAAKDHGENSGGTGAAYVRFGQDGKIRFRSVTTTNPKSLDGVQSDYALFQGTYDPSADRWTVTDARPITGEMFDALSDAYVDSDNDTAQFANEEQRAEQYDRELNSVYSAVRFILPKPEFEKVKAAQIAWLKQRDAAPSLEEKNRRVLARTKALQDLLW